MFLILNLCIAGELFAQDMSIYRAHGSVKDQSDTQRNIAASLHLGELVVRVSGRRDAVNNPVIQRSIAKASSYLFSFSYTGKIVETVEGKPQTRLGIQLDYSPQAINQLLREAELPLWPAPRPRILLWTVFRDSTGLQRVPYENALVHLQAESELRGLKITLPEWDLEDNIAVSANDIWQLNIEKIKAASARYKADVIVIGRYQPASMGVLPQVVDTAESSASEFTQAVSNVSAPPVAIADSQDASESAKPLGPWIVKWQVIDGTGQQSWSGRANEVFELFGHFTHKLADHLASQYSISLSQQAAQTYYLQISHIRDFSAMKKSQAYLKSLPIIQKSELIKVDEQGLLLALTIEGDPRLLASTLSLGKRLFPEVTSLPRAQTITPLDAAQSLPSPENIISQPEFSEPRGSIGDPLRYIWQDTQ